MGHRDIKRVALDFSWPMNKVWEGYINPHYRNCAACDGRGETPGRRAMTNLFHLLIIAADDSVYVMRPGDTRSFPHPWLQGIDVTRPEHLSRDIDELVSAIVGPVTSPFGRNTYEAGKLLNKLVEAAGLDPAKWGLCQACGGHGEDPTAKPAADAWQEYEPPAGEGWQLWETVSEGSPVSPVFKTSRELAAWAAHNATLFASHGATEEEWLRLIDEDKLSVGSFGMMNTATGEFGTAKDIVLKKGDQHVGEDHG